MTCIMAGRRCSLNSSTLGTVDELAVDEKPSWDGGLSAKDWGVEDMGEPGRHIVDVKGEWDSQVSLTCTYL